MLLYHFNFLSCRSLLGTYFLSYGLFGFTKDICRRRSGYVLSHIRKRFSWWWKYSSKWKKLTLYWPVLECVGEKLLVKKQVSFTFLADLCLGHICSHMGFFGFTKYICRRRSGHVLSHIRKRFSWWWKCSSKWKKLTLYWPVLECVGEKLLVKKQVSWRTRAPVRFLMKDNRQGNFQVSVASKKYFSFHVVPVYSESDYLIFSWWGSGHQGKHFEKEIRDKTSFFSSFFFSTPRS